MISRVSCLVTSLCVFLSAALWVDAGEDSTLRLVTNVGGLDYDNFVIENGRIVGVSDNGRISVPQYATWRLEGNLPRGGTAMVLAPGYSIARLPAPEWQLKSVERPYEISVTVDLDSRSPNWSDRQLEGSVAVLAWIVDHKPVRVFAVDGRSVRSSTIRFVATAEETRGSPVFLLRRGREFIKPTPFFQEDDANNGLNALHFGSGPALARVLESMESADRRGRQSQTLLHLAAAAGFSEGIDALLAVGASVDAHDRAGRTPLHHAAANGRRDAVQHLLAAGADPNEVDKRRFPAFFDATIFGHQDVALDLLKAGADARKIRFKWEVGAELALEHGRARVLEALLDQEGTGILQRSLEQLVVENARALRFDVVAVLLKHGAPADVATADGTRALAFAAQTDVPRYIEMMLDAGAVIDRNDASGETALMSAVMRHNAVAVATLLKHGADVDAVDREGNSALHLAVQERNPAIVEILGGHGADLNLKNARGEMPIDLALANRDAKCGEALIAVGARFDFKAPGLLDRLEAAIALDLGELVARAAEDGWDEETTFQGKWPLATVVEFHSALRTAQWLKENVPPSPQPVILAAGEVDGVAQPVSVEMPADPRPGDWDYPATTVKVNGLLDTDGRLLFARVSESRDSRLKDAVLNQVSTWKFVPATRSGSPVSTRLTIPVTFPPRNERIYEITELSVEPQIYRTNSVSVSIGWDDRFDPIGSLDSRPEHAVSSGSPVNIPFGLTYPAAVLPDGSQLAVIRCVVEKSGIVGAFEVIRAPRKIPEDDIRRLLHKLEFSAGKVKDERVRSRVTLTLWL